MRLPRWRKRTGRQGEAALGGDGTGVGGDQSDVVPAVDVECPGGTARPGEHLEGSRHVEGLHAGVRHDHHAAVGHVPHRAPGTSWRQ